jgi:nucleotide-binding universal stress UspA family protein
MPKEKKVLIAYDGSAGADAALLDLKLAGFPAQTSALVLSVADVFLPPAGMTEKSIPESIAAAAQKGWEHANQKVKAAKDLAQKAADKIKSDFPNWQVQAEAVADSPAWGIIKKAEDWKADVIVVGAHGLPLPERLILGSVSQMVATQARCSVRIVHSKPEDVSSLPRIIIGVDGSSFSYDALHEAASREWKKGTSVHVITAVDPRMVTAVFSSEKSLEQWLGTGQDRGQRWIQRLIQDAERILQAKGLTVTTLEKEGDVKKTLLDEASRWGANCIFVGSRGLSGIKHSLIGSVSSAMAARARCSVEIVRKKV